MTDALTKASRLSFWTGPVDPQPLGGGITNVNFVVEDAGRKYVVRVGNDIPVHQVMRFNELAASRAAEAIGLSPALRHYEPGALVIDFVEGRTLTEEDVRNPETLSRIVPLIRRCHQEMPAAVRGPVLMFWVFHVIRDYAATLRDGGSRHTDKLDDLLTTSADLERAVGPVDVVFGHNDLLCGNFIDDGDRIWLIDWDYAGFNSPLFDLGGLASNNGIEGDQERELLRLYFGADPTPDLCRRYEAMKCASLLRETMWSMVSEIHSEIDFDYSAYTSENLSRLNAALATFRSVQVQGKQK